MAKYKRPGMGGGGGGGTPNMQNLIKQAKKMQEDAERATAELADKEYSASSGGGAVKVTVTGERKLKSVEIDPESVDPEDIEFLCDMIVAAANEALKAAEEESNAVMSALTGGMSLPGM
jgi:DNA-binding YbaB/EbfC family protein